ncbi:hypothetical protein M430DRAFT_199107 [Amorphotheca resinae ATCC 22711]|jgi:hypothetical protein|uniref:Uncharacterized protein n=1 Tax=Amorphotheca resinae ATCC 22711 TaxID=857342 RepID=A0A2T3BA65_AMORE|nr:hypothetical protein M430DRAFT_199107 [Amorphotheca resinae ATCC 22711]PSS25170.1 hypothetical protein M430DRAFT_199107 [Amorphotheca resinae ATCC 22711]
MWIKVGVGRPGRYVQYSTSTCIAFLQGSLLDSKRSIVRESIVLGIKKNPISCICSPLQAVQPQRGMGIFITGVPQLISTLLTLFTVYLSPLGADAAYTCLSSTVALISYLAQESNPEMLGSLHDWRPRSELQELRLYNSLVQHIHDVHF